jgi:hypothetical protein
MIIPIPIFIPWLERKKEKSFDQYEQQKLIKEALQDMWSRIDFSTTKFVVFNNQVRKAHVSINKQPIISMCLHDEGDLLMIHRSYVFDDAESAKECLDRINAPRTELELKLISWRGGYKLVPVKE